MRDAVLTVIKREGPLSLQAIQRKCNLSATTVRHHLGRLRREGLVECGASGGCGVGRPAVQYVATARAEGHFPKRYAELLNAVLLEAESSLLIAALMERVVARLAEPLTERLQRTAAAERLHEMLASMDYGEMLATVESFEDSHELHAANCLYRDTGQQFVQVCDLLPRVITATGFFRAERIECQRDGARTCDFSIVEFGAQR